MICYLRLKLIQKVSTHEMSTLDFSIPRPSPKTAPLNKINQINIKSQKHTKHTKDSSIIKIKILKELS